MKSVSLSLKDNFCEEPSPIRAVQAFPTVSLLFPNLNTEIHHVQRIYL